MLVVVLFHAGLGFPGGFVGVDVFFVISGFVITAMLADEHRSGGVHLGRFYLRRIRRLLPALALVLVVVLALAPLLGPRNADSQTIGTARAGALFGANIELIGSSQGYFDARTEANAFLHLWTLSVEEQFYLGFPLLLLLAAATVRRFGPPKGRAKGLLHPLASGVLAAAAAVSFIAAWAFAGHHVPGLGDIGGRVAFYSAPTRAWEFLAGALLALAVARGVVVRRAMADALGVLGLILISVAVLGFDATTSFPLIVGVVPVMAAILLILGGTGSGSGPVGRVSSMLAARPMRWVGDRSYGWYIWHWPLIVFARATFPGVGWAAPAAAALSLAVAAVSYRVVEKPIRHRPPRAVPTLTLGAVCIALPLLVAQSTPLVRERIDRNRALVAVNFQLRRHLDLKTRCTDSVPNPASREACTWPATGHSAGSGTAVLLGDSNAGQFTEGFIAGAGMAGLGATVQTRSGCPFADLELRRLGVVDARCRAFYEAQMAALEASPPKVVVLASAADLRVVDDTSALKLPDGAVWATEPDTKTTVWRDALSRTVARLDGLGISVVVVRPIPRFGGWPAPGECARATVLVDEASCATERPTIRTRLLSGQFDVAETEAVSGRKRASLVDVGPLLCPETTCRTLVGGQWVFRDESHITVRSSEALAPLFDDTLRSAAASSG